ncbi:hypothetical protein BTR23_12900 [Alkalihalophilus pseudofirmus]|nr:hypothetical protein BTR23_12900 [Alkalihalophilus pseudofirmus]
MQIEQLEYLIEIAKAGTISAASKKLHVTQSAISQSLSSLEEELGVTLFQRSRIGTIPTEEGQKVIQKAMDIVQKIQELKDEMQTEKMAVKGELKLASIPTFMTFLLNPLADFKVNYPHVNIEIKEQETKEVIDAIIEQRVDLGMIAMHEKLKEKTNGLEFLPLIKGEMQVYVNKNSPLAVYDTITLDQLVNQTIVMYNGDFIRSFVNDFLHRIGPLNILFSSNNINVIRKAILKNLAITFSPSWYTENQSFPSKNNVKALRIVNHPPVNVAFGLAYSKKRAPSATSVKFIKYVESAIHNEKGLNR